MSPRARRIAWAALAVILGSPLAFKAVQGWTHAAAPRQHAYENRGDRASVARGDYQSAEFCGGCHSEIYDQWKESYLSRTWERAATEVLLHEITLRLRGMEPQEKRFCLECHAPLALADPEDLAVDDPLGQEGVTCVVCHSVREVWTDTNPARMTNTPLEGMRGPFEDAVSPWHRTLASSTLQRWDDPVCGSCHSSHWPLSELPIDWTWQEWHEAAEPVDANCRACHMPAYVGKAAQLEGVPERTLRRHTFPGGHDPDMVAEAVALAFVAVERGPHGAFLVLDVQNMAGHDLPSGNPPAPELRLRACAGACPPEGGALDIRSYRASQLMASGENTYDVTIAATQGPSTALKPWETRRERLALPPDLEGAVEVRADFSYWRPTEPPERYPAYFRTIRQHLGNPQVSLGRLAATLLRPQTWEVLYAAWGASKSEPLPVDALRIDLATAEVTARWSEGEMELSR
ncbi:MAG: multiheme c-type cytochrome [Pseudomonadota bacterium]